MKQSVHFIKWRNTDHPNPLQAVKTGLLAFLQSHLLTFHTSLPPNPALTDDSPGLHNKSAVFQRFFPADLSCCPLQSACVWWVFLQ